MNEPTPSSSSNTRYLQLIEGISTLLPPLFDRYHAEKGRLEDVLKELGKQTIEWILARMSIEELLKGLSIEERLKGLSIDEIVRVLPPEFLAAVCEIKSNGSPPRAE